MMKKIFLVAGMLLAAIVSGNESNDAQQIEWGCFNAHMIVPEHMPFLRDRANEGYFDRLREELFPDSACMRIVVDDKFRLCTEGPFTVESFCYANVCLIYAMLVGEDGDKSFVESLEPEVKKSLKEGIKTIISSLGEGMMPYKSIVMSNGDKETLRYDFYGPYDVTRRETAHSALYPLLIMKTSTKGDFTSYMLYVMSGRFTYDVPYYKGFNFLPTDEKHMKRVNDEMELVIDLPNPISNRNKTYYISCVSDLSITMTCSGGGDARALFGKKQPIREILSPLWKP